MAMIMAVVSLVTLIAGVMMDRVPLEGIVFAGLLAVVGVSFVYAGWAWLWPQPSAGSSAWLTQVACLRCGYSLTGHMQMERPQHGDALRCPECGLEAGRLGAMYSAANLVVGVVGAGMMLFGLLFGLSAMLVVFVVLDGR